MGYLTEKIQEPTVDDTTYEKWSMENAIVKGWLAGSIEPGIMSLFVPLPIAKSIWDIVSQTYYQGADRSIIMTSPVELCT